MSRQFLAMRGIAILFVLINHSITMSLWMADRIHYQPPSQAVLVILTLLKQMGLYAVPIFLFLSGAFFAYAVQNQPLTRSYRTVWSNVLSTFWPYLIWSLVFYLVSGLLTGERSSLLQYAKNILVGYPFNFIPLLIFFYILAPFISLAIRRSPVALLAGVLAIQFLQAVIVDPYEFGFVINLPNWMHYLAIPVIRSELAIWGIFFPLGMVYQQNQKQINLLFQKPAIYLAIASFAFYLVDVLHELNVVRFPLAATLCPILGLFVTPVIKRDKIPFYKWDEMIGKLSYGLYLINLIVLFALLFGIQLVLPWLLGQYILLVPLLFMLVISIGWGFMSLLKRPPQRIVYPYLFG